MINLDLDLVEIDETLSIYGKSKGTAFWMSQNLGHLRFWNFLIVKFTTIDGLKCWVIPDIDLIVTMAFSRLKCCARGASTPWLMPLRQGVFSLAHGHTPCTPWRMPMRQGRNKLWRMPMRQRELTMRQELFPGASWFIPGNNSCARIFWHICHMPVIINFQTLHLW